MEAARERIAQLEDEAVALCDKRAAAQRDVGAAKKSIAELDAQLIEARALLGAGKYDRGLAVATVVVREAAGLGYEPLQARAWLVQGRLQDRTGAYAEAEATLERAYASALGLKMVTEAADATRVGTATPLLPDTLSRYTTLAPLSTPRCTTSEVSALSRSSIGEAALRSSEWSPLPEMVDAARQYPSGPWSSRRASCNWVRMRCTDERGSPVLLTT